MVTCFDSEKDRTAKEEGWAPPFNSCVQGQYSGTLIPTALARLWETLFYFSL